MPNKINKPFLPPLQREVGATCCTRRDYKKWRGHRVQAIFGVFCLLFGGSTIVQLPLTKYKIYLTFSKPYIFYLISLSSNGGYILLKSELMCLKYDVSILSIVSLVVRNLQFLSGTPGIFILASEPKPHIS